MGNVGMLLLAAEEEREGIELVLPDMAELVWGIISFVVVVGLLWKYAFPKIRAAVEAREAEIAGNLQSAEDQKSEAQRLLDEYKAQLAESRAEANKILEEARQSAEKVRKDLIAKAEQDAAGVVERAQEQIEAQRGQAMEELRAEVRNLAIVVAEKVVGDSLDKSRQSKLVDEYIAEVGTMSNGGARN